jgi:hypothetical protein
MGKILNVVLKKGKNLKTTKSGGIPSILPKQLFQIQVFVLPSWWSNFHETRRSIQWTLGYTF